MLPLNPQVPTWAPMVVKSKSLLATEKPWDSLLVAPFQEPKSVLPGWPHLGLPHCLCTSFQSHFPTAEEIGGDSFHTDLWKATVGR